jgi:hypothetical protein
MAEFSCEGLIEVELFTALVSFSVSWAIILGAIEQF